MTCANLSNVPYEIENEEIEETEEKKSEKKERKKIYDELY
jgi:hypothetical protein